MNTSLPLIATPVAVLTVLLGCSEVTGPSSILDQFNWEEVGNPSTVEEGIDTQAAFGDIFILGQIRTPTRCYELDPNFEHSGNTLTLRIEAQERNTSTCADGVGGYRYTAVIRNLDRGETYEVRVLHRVGSEVNEYSATLEN